ncbi:swi5-dependent recombination DNA repair protein 1 homolog [Dunckerocampus dactyliophorus]|uniref:swi5-dependent recombination DNA repair protein 1 homolog n=1 Tax=Dunckerocampus dactyliophorus TaxID=161453 RepID=UPI0024068D35|nr:swi5-dependent recombination DNA repair protein 1 homolog [Dunckerocampus dactyliophorus]
MDVTRKNVSLKSVYSSQSVLKTSTNEPNETPHQKMSSSLKERLKRSRRSFTSPIPVAKRLCVDEEDGQPLPADSQITDNTNTNAPPASSSANVNGQEVRPGSEKFSRMVPGRMGSRCEDFAQQRVRLSREVKDKTETLRRLKMVKMYRSKNDLNQLQTLIDKWRRCAQDALYQLRSDVPVDGRKANLSELIDLFGLDDKILHFDRREDEFSS